MIFILVALQHHWMLYTVLNLESSAFLFHLLSNIPSSAPFAFLPPIFFTIFTHQPLSPSSLIYSHGNTNSHLSSFRPSLQPSFDSSPLYYFIFCTLLCFPLPLLLPTWPPTVCPSITFTHMATHSLPLCPCPLCPSLIHPYPYFIPHFCSHAAPHCVLPCVLSTRMCLFHL